MLQYMPTLWSGISYLQYYVKYFSLFFCTYYCKWEEKNICWIYITIFIKTILLLFLICFIIDYFIRLLYLWRVCWLITARYFLELNSFILLVRVSWRNLLLFACKRRLWVSIPFIFEYNFDLIIQSSDRSWLLFTFCHKIKFPTYLNKHL